MDIYDKMAEYYDLIYDDDTDLAFYVNEAQNTRGSILEIACGTGRILLTLQQLGLDITGLDMSEPMLRVLKNKAEALGLVPSVIKADMCNFNIDKQFKLIILPYRSFLHLNNEQKCVALQNFFRQLDKGGRLIIHSYNASDDECQMLDRFHLFDFDDRITVDNQKYHIEWHLKYEPKPNIGHYKIILNFESNAKYEYDMDLYFISVNSLYDLLKNSGYKNIRFYCGFDYSQYDENCKEVILIAEK
ncbi:class I SAM-dependent methyltransferase [Candidatus Micrarchaeota archaeon]|nr:class I SAM-dependent methyltransferase [Candidatus Micrarchaeota archaeon]MBU1166640.1 class I SAM-dependent methyltransferase [Candidatus Micrarchaeota archaeon]MBU1886597.1 class I SAM-dependent methyltransferase [Candidatus Micrarchaeota archaeon]